MRMARKVCIGLLCALALGGGTGVAHGQDASSFAVDGDWRDWGRSGPGEGEDLDEVEAALAGEWLEGSVPWDTPEDEERGYYLFRWSARTTRGGSHDYLPGGDPCCDVPWTPLQERISTIAEPQFGGGLDHMGE